MSNKTFNDWFEKTGRAAGIPGWKIDMYRMLAKAIAKGREEQTVARLGEPVWDDSYKVEHNIIVPRQPDYVVLPNGQTASVANIEKPAEKWDADLTNPAHLVKAEVKVNGVLCPSCVSDAEKPGFELKHPEVKYVIQCQNCGLMIYLSGGNREVSTC